MVGAGWIAQEDFMPGVEHTGNSVMTALVTGDAEKAKEVAKKYDIENVTDYDGYDALVNSGKDRRHLPRHALILNTRTLW